MANIWRELYQKEQERQESLCRFLGRDDVQDAIEELPAEVVQAWIEMLKD